LLLGDGRFQRQYVAGDLVGDFIFGDFQVVAGLQIHPKCRAVVEVAGEAQRGIRGASLAFGLLMIVHDFNLVGV
jgi:hypothetical protein